MKQKRFFLYFLTVLMVTAMGIGGVSCSNDDDSENSESNSSLSGTSWAYEEDYKSGVITFNSGGKGTWTKHYTDYYDNETKTFSFTYKMLKKNTGTIVTKEKSDSHSSGYDTENYYFEVEGELLYIYEVDDDDEDDMELKYICYQVSGNTGNNSQTTALGGTSWVNQEGRYTRTLNFKSNGTGTAIFIYQDSYSGTETETTSFTYTYNSSKKSGTIIVREYDSYKGQYTNEVYGFKIDGKKLYLYDEDEDYGQIIFTKK